MIDDENFTFVFIFLLFQRSPALILPRRLNDGVLEMQASHTTQSLSLVLSQRGGVGSPTGNHFRYSHHVKGTLSNRLFGATFDVMDETE